MTLWSPLRGGEVLTEVRVRLPLSTVNRHGLVAGATGTGKTKTHRFRAPGPQLLGADEGSSESKELHSPHEN